METILNDVCKIVSNLFNISLDDVKNNEERCLFSQPFYFRPTELLFIFFYLEEKYNIHFDEKDVFDFSFISIRSIANNVSNHINN
ncbi:hypothetical protein KQI41_05320 [Tissierella pigra]|uniref:Peptide maturation system acyl carrier-related protein n=1 Tax=Tissierella pigra TaxID=2607614 RepID=A0A6N7XYF1_9FIRM|nr:hypothetical protein [Tissierella pigra]MBU5425828.1 hypothetical protein [Tissierella pigra]MSU01594.1 hypothetical protein [Tissierella pigra]